MSQPDNLTESSIEPEQAHVAGWTEELARVTWLVVPLYNEGQVVREVLLEAKRTFPNIVCVNDGSTDNSASEALAAGVDLVEHPVNLGAGAAMRTGLDYALKQPGAKYFVTFDSDGQHRVVDAQAMVVRLSKGNLDIILGSRFLDNRTKPGFMKRIVLKAGIVFERIITGVKLTDAHNGLRALNVNAASKIRINQNRMAHASELLTEIRRNHLRYAEEPVYIIYTDYSRSKGQSLWNSVNIISELVFK